MKEKLSSFLGFLSNTASLLRTPLLCCALQLQFGVFLWVINSQKAESALWSSMSLAELHSGESSLPGFIMTVEWCKWKEHHSLAMESDRFRWVVCVSAGCGTQAVLHITAGIWREGLALGSPGLGDAALEVSVISIYWALIKMKN